jgi:hypothetical protein
VTTTAPAAASSRQRRAPMAATSGTTTTGCRRASSTVTAAASSRRWAGTASSRPTGDHARTSTRTPRCRSASATGTSPATRRSASGTAPTATAPKATTGTSGLASRPAHVRQCSGDHPGSPSTSTRSGRSRRISASAVAGVMRSWTLVDASRWPSPVCSTRRCGKGGRSGVTEGPGTSIRGAPDPALRPGRHVPRSDGGHRRPGRHGPSDGRAAAQLVAQPCRLLRGVTRVGLRHVPPPSATVSFTRTVVLHATPTVHPCRPDTTVLGMTGSIPTGGRRRVTAARACEDRPSACPAPPP